MCISFSSESNPLYKNSFVSRFLIFMMPVSKYYIQGKKKEETNLSLQEALKIITASLNKLGVEGSHGLRGVCASIRGDWKWLVQALQLKYGPSSNEICAVCKATRGLQVPLTDLSDSAGWRSQLRDGEVWFARPPLANLRNFSMRLVTFDIMHTFHLGFGRDLAASVLVFLLKKDCFPGPNALALTEKGICGLNLFFALLRLKDEECKRANQTVGEVELKISLAVSLEPQQTQLVFEDKQVCPLCWESVAPFCTPWFSE